MKISYAVRAFESIDTPRLFEQKSRQIIRKVRIRLQNFAEFTTTHNFVEVIEYSVQNSIPQSHVSWRCNFTCQGNSDWEFIGCQIEIGRVTEFSGCLLFQGLDAKFVRNLIDFGVEYQRRGIFGSFVIEVVHELYHCFHSINLKVIDVYSFVGFFLFVVSH